MSDLDVSEVPRMQTVQDEVQVLRHALGWLLEVMDIGDEPGPRDRSKYARAWLYAQEVFDKTNPHAERRTGPLWIDT